MPQFRILYNKLTGCWHGAGSAGMEGLLPHDTLKFIDQFVKSPFSIGAVAPTSRQLAEVLMAPFDFRSLSTLVEIGPGTGAITSVIQDKLLRPSQYMGIELNAAFYAVAKEKFPALTFFNEDAGDLRLRLDAQKVDFADGIVSSLPWATLPPPVQDKLLNEIHRCLRPGGLFVTYAYIQGMLLPAAWRFRSRLKTKFPDTRMTNVVWENFPPAFGYISRR